MHSRLVCEPCHARARAHKPAHPPEVTQRSDRVLIREALRSFQMTISPHLVKTSSRLKLNDNPLQPQYPPLLFDLPSPFNNPKVTACTWDVMGTFTLYGLWTHVRCYHCTHAVKQLRTSKRVSSSLAAQGSGGPSVYTMP